MMMQLQRLQTKRGGFVRRSLPRGKLARVGGMDWNVITVSAHCATDVLGGYLLGFLWLCIVWHAFAAWRHA
jgi:hypothetical protein